MICIKQTEKENILPLRHKVLRQNKPQESADFEGDDNIGTIHLAYFDENDQVIGCLSMLVTADFDFDAIPQYRLRGMAVEESHRNQQVGTALVKMAEFVALNNEVECLWLNARESAKDFYLKQGFEVVGEPFEVEGIGKHFKMVKYPTEHVCCNAACADCIDKNNCNKSK